MKSEESQPFFKQISREKRANLTSGMDKDLRKGNRPMYKISYSEIDKSPHLVWDILKVHKSKTHSRPVSMPQPPDLEEELSKPIPEKLDRKRICGIPDLRKETSREQLSSFMAK